MKFGKLLQRTSSLIPQLEGWLIHYKELKKRVKELKRLKEQCQQMESRPQLEGDRDQLNKLYNEVQKKQDEFVQAVYNDVDRSNDLFVEQEEMAIIHMTSLDDEYRTLTPSHPLEEIFQLKLDYECQRTNLVLLLHWVLLSFAGIAKILKKYDKLVGSNFLAMFLETISRQPFYSTTYISQYLLVCSERIDELKSLLNNDQRGVLVVEQYAHLECKLRVAVGLCSELSRTAHTPSTKIPIELLDKFPWCIDRALEGVGESG
eukprot:TRINITY_DN13892_c0_g1_i3.p1 TRINITY_DN13892_c0_g1~~TRINITY_DN13892_c0_g1_i3.p1  ORF type:complete len:261 (-),score=29.57 TRINITY_DN13892_c0_g1_i3:201-983(-)